MSRYAEYCYFVTKNLTNQSARADSDFSCKPVLRVPVQGFQIWKS